MGLVGRWLLLLCVAALAALAGCGGDDEEKKAKAKADDTAAMSMVRNAVTEMETCYTDTQDYSQCGNEELAESGLPGLKVGSGPGQVNVDETSMSGYTITAHSRSGNSFTIKREIDGALAYSCSDSGAKQAGCENGKWSSGVSQ